MDQALARFGSPLEAWHGRSVAAWREAWGVPALRIYQAVGSTNDVAWTWAEHGAEEGATVLTDEQTEGRGRRGRVWRSAPGQSLLLSMVVRPATMGDEALLSIRLGLATARAIEDVAPLAVGVKWPNDLQVDGRKVGGMLCEGATMGGRPAFVIAGTGVNVLQPDDAWTGELAGMATSLAARVGAPVSVPGLAERVVARWRDVLDAPGETLAPGEMESLRNRDVLAGLPVTVDGERAGVAQGVAPDGALVVADADGRARRVRSGTVRAVESDAGDDA